MPYKLNGITRNSGGSALSGATVKVFRTDTDAFVGSDTSNGSGEYEVLSLPNTPLYAMAYLDGSPDIAGVTVNTLIPTEYIEGLTGTMSAAESGTDIFAATGSASANASIRQVAQIWSTQAVTNGLPANTIFSTTVTLSQAAIAGNYILVFLAIDKTANGTTSLSYETGLEILTNPNTSTALSHTTGSSISGVMFGKVAVGGETSFAFTHSSAVITNGPNLVAIEVENVSASPYDRGVLSHDNASGTDDTTLVIGPTGTTTQANELAIAFWAVDSVSSVTADVGFNNSFSHYATYRTGYTHNGQPGVAVATKSLTGTGTVTTTATHTGTADETLGVIVTLKSAV
jgi:hypothetical protein